jgi:hypothetical protein
VRRRAVVRDDPAFADLRCVVVRRAVARAVVRRAVDLLVAALRWVVVRRVVGFFAFADLRCVVRRAVGFFALAVLRCVVERLGAADRRVVDLLIAALRRGVVRPAALFLAVDLRAVRRRPSAAAWPVWPRRSFDFARLRLRLRSFGESYFDAPASLSAIAIACLRFFTLRLPRAVFSSPRLYSCMTRLTVFFCAGL